MTLDWNYSYLHRDITGAATLFATGTTHKTVATATLRLPRGATALVSTRCQSGIVAISDNGLRLPAATFTTVDVGAWLPLCDEVRLRMGIKNLLDRDYCYWEGFPEQGRTWHATLRYVF